MEDIRSSLIKLITATMADLPLFRAMPFPTFWSEESVILSALEMLFLCLLIINTFYNNFGNSWRRAVLEHRCFKNRSPILQCSYLLLTNSSKGGNALFTRRAGAFSRDFEVCMMTRQDVKTASPVFSTSQDICRKNACLNSHIAWDRLAATWLFTPQRKPWCLTCHSTLLKLLKNL